MKKVLIGALMMLFLFGISLSLADDKCPAAKSGAGCCAKGKTQAAASVTQISETKVEDPHAACAEKHEEQAVTSTAATAETKVETAPAAVAPVSEEAKPADEAKIPEGSCPDVGGRDQLNTFHESMHPMHMALEESKYAELRELYPKLKDASKGLADYKCPMWDKCSKECKKDFETKKASLLMAIDDLGVSCKGEDNAKIETTFAVMHDAYVAFASKCVLPKPAKAEEAKAEEIKTEETK